MDLTCPAFGLFQSIFALIGLPLHVTIPIVNILLDAGIALVLIRLLQGQEHSRKLIPISLGLLILSPSLARTSVGGMEMTSLYLVR